MIMLEQRWQPAQKLLESEEVEDETVEEPEFECRICLELPTEPCVSRCGHLFCRGCLVQWLDFSPKCPACKTPSSMKDVVPMFVTTTRAPRPTGSPIRSRTADAPRIVYSSVANEDMAVQTQSRYQSSKPPSSIRTSNSFLQDPSLPVLASVPPSPFSKHQTLIPDSLEISSSSPSLLPSPRPFRFFSDERAGHRRNPSNEDGYLSDPDKSSDSMDAGLVTWPAVPTPGNYDFMTEGQQQFSRVLSVVALALMVTALLPSK